MNKKIFTILLMLCLIPFSVSAGITSIYTVWVESPNAGASEVGTMVTVEQGDPINLYKSISTFTNTLGYRVKITQTDQILIPHTTVQGNSCGGGIGCSSATYEVIDTSNIEVGNNYRIEVSGNDDGVSGQYDETIFLYLNIEEPVCENYPPNAPTNPNPNNGAIDVNLNPTLSWTGSDPDDDSLTYDVYFGTNPNPTNRVANDISQTSYQTNTPNYETTYYWKVVASDGEFETSSNIWSFTTEEEDIPENQPPNAPTNLNPENGATNIDLTPTLSWTGSDPDGDNLVFDVYFGTSLNQMSKVADDISEEYYQLQTLDYGSTYFWKVVANDGEFSTPSNRISFTTQEEIIPENHAPNAPTNLNPEYEATEIDLNPLLTWTGSDPDGDDLTYTVYFATTPVLGPNNIIGTTTQEQFQLNNLDYNTIYFWGILASDGEFETGTGPWVFTTVEEGTPENHAPVLENINNQKTKCRKEFNLQIIASDQDNDELTYYDNSDLFNINSETGLISFTPDCDDRGKYDIQITVVDEHGATTTESFQLEIYRATSGGNGGDGDDEVEEETELITKEGMCRDDLDGDNFGIKTIIYKTLDPLTREILSFETVEESCLLKQKNSFMEEIAENAKGNRNLILWVALVFLIITIPIAIYIYYKLA